MDPYKGGLLQKVITFFLNIFFYLSYAVLKVIYLFKKKEPKGSQLISIVGLLMVSYSIIKFDESTPFPSIYTLLPTVGVALIIIFTSPHTMIYRLLSKKFLVGIGLISYSAYLWHKPLFAFSRIYSIDKPSLVVYAVLILLTFFSFREA